MPGQLTRKAIAAQPSGSARCPNGRRAAPSRTELASSSPGAVLPSMPRSRAAAPRRRSRSCWDCAGRGRPRRLQPRGRDAAHAGGRRRFQVETWLITGRRGWCDRARADNVVVATPEVEESYCHTVSYTCAIATVQALLGEDVSGLPDAVERELGAEPLGVSRSTIASSLPEPGGTRDSARGSAEASRGRPGSPQRRTTRSSSSTAISLPSTRRCGASSSRERVVPPSVPSMRCTRWPRSAARRSSCQRAIPWSTSSASSV